jgi:hypothetical protein
MSVTQLNPFPELLYATPSIRPAMLSDRVLAFADRHRGALFVVLLGFYLLGFNGKWRLEPDSALYLSIGRNLAEGYGYTYQGVRHHLAFPGPPYLFAAVFKIFPGESLVPHLLLMLAIGLATLGLTYRLFWLYADRPTAVLITFGVGISRLFYRYTFELLSDMPFLLGVMAFLAGYEAIFHRRRDGRRVTWFDCVLFSGGLLVAVAMRPTMWALLAAAVLALLWSVVRGPTRWPQLITCLAIVMAAVIFWKIDPRHSGSSLGNYEDAVFNVKFSHFSTLLHDMVFDYAPRFFNGTLAQALFGARFLPGIDAVIGIIVLALGISLFWHRPLWGLWFATTIGMMLVAVKPLDRYFLQVLPLLVFAWWSAIRWLNKTIPGRWGNRIFLALFVLGGTTNLLRDGEFIIEQRRPQFLNYYKEGRFASIDRLGRLLREQVGENDIVLAPPKQARIITFLSHRRTVEMTPENRVNPALQTVYVLEPLDEPVKQWLAGSNAHLGSQIGADISNQLNSTT